MHDFSEFMLLLPEIIVEYLNWLPIKGDEILHFT
jgi:hypothetical protein